jgi:DNA-binding NarL/FixJ family response regulator
MVRAVNPDRSGCTIGVLTRAETPLARSTVTRWKRLSAHLAAGLRLRARLSAPTKPSADGEAVLRPDGRVEHATGDAKATAARDALKAGARAVDRARGALRRRDADEAVEVWRGLVAGRWSLIDRFESDGRRYLVAHRNAPDVPDPRALTERERQVLGYADLGHPNKLIAYHLGLSPSTVGVLLVRARLKVRGLSGR